MEAEDEGNGMSEIAIRQDGTALTMADPTGGRLVAWAEAAHAANQLAKALARTSFVPVAFKGNEGDATAAILLGDELGLSPLAALRSIYIVHGTPALYARTMVALALSHGHQVWTEKTTNTEVVVCGQRKGSSHVERAVWTMARAAKAGYTTNKKYSSNGEEMLYSKAAGEVARKIAADVLAGVPASVEDLELAEPEPTTTVTRLPTTSRTVRRNVPVEPAEPSLDAAAAPAGHDAPTAARAAFTTAEGRRLEPAPAPGFDQSEPEPTFDQSEPVDVTGMEAVELIRPQQSRKMMALFNEHGFKNRDDRLAYVRDIIGIDIASSKDLTVQDASKVIEALANLDTPTPDSTP